MSRKPLHSLRARGMDVAIWEGNTGPQFTFRKTYKDRDSGEWKESKILFRQDIEALVTLLEEALAKSATDEGMLFAGTGCYWKTWSPQRPRGLCFPQAEPGADWEARKGTMA